MDTTRLEKAAADIKREVDYYGSAFPKTKEAFLAVALEDVPRLLRESKVLNAVFEAIRNTKDILNLAKNITKAIEPFTSGNRQHEEIQK